MTPTNPDRSTPAHRVALAMLALFVVAATVVAVVTTSPAEDADARPAAVAATPAELLPYGDLLLDSERSRADEAAERAQADRVRRFLEGAAAAEAERRAAEAAAAAAAARAEAERAAAATSSMGGGWAALRRCESGGDYGAVSANGSYRGAYQFSRSTWNSVAARSRPHLVGVDPGAASPADQDAMALALYNSSGSSPWPHCGRHL